MINIYNALKHLTNDRNKNGQLDFYRNEQIILQIFRTDSKYWEYKFKTEEVSFIVLLTFNKNKFDNESNLLRLKKNHLFKYFKYSTDSINSNYTMTIPFSISFKEIENTLIKLLKSVYILNDSDILKLDFNLY